MDEPHDVAMHADPAEVLGVSAEATVEQIRAAYLQRVKEHPPDRSPEMFERIRDAYQVLSDPRRRAARMLLAEDPERPLARVLDDAPPARLYVGPEPWLAVLKER